MGEKQGYLPFPEGFSTTAIHHSQEPDQWDSLAVVAPLVTSTNFKQSEQNGHKTYAYSRVQNPTREILENVLAKLDNGKYGLTFSSGMSAISAVLGLLKSGDNIIVADHVYGGTDQLFSKIAVRSDISVSSIDLTDIENLEPAIKPNSKLIWFETPTNPILKVIDIKAVVKIAKKNNLIVAVDNTFLTPYLQRPLELGADLVVYSVTKYLNGHSDVIMGAITMADKNLYNQLKFIQSAMGIIPSPFDCYQVNRSLKTLTLRMKQHNKNGLILAKFLESHPKVEKVRHPGLTSHPQHELFKSQTSGHSGIFSFYLKGGLYSSNLFLKSVKLFTVAGSLGGYESLIVLPRASSHISVPAETRLALGITDNLIRISVGFEDAKDLVADLKQALERLP